MKNTVWAAAAAMGMLGFAGCGARWSVSDPRFFRYQNKDVRLTGVIQKAEAHANSDDGTSLEARLYQDDYSTIISTFTHRVGKELAGGDSEGKRVVFEVPIKEPRLGGTANSYSYLCAEIRVDSSNLSDWTRVGCIHDTDPPSENPAGQ